MPQRIQLSRKKGWRKPAGAVVVTRSTRWGNPFPVIDDDREFAVHLYRSWITLHPQAQPLRDDLKTLRGKDLCCWCPLDQPCHADVLLELANQPTKENSEPPPAPPPRQSRPMV